MSEFDAFRERWGESKFDPKKHRHRVNKQHHLIRRDRAIHEPEEGDDPNDPKFRRPSSAISCSARYRERYIMPEAIALLKAMTPIEAKEACLNVLKDLGFTVILRTPR